MKWHTMKKKPPTDIRILTWNRRWDSPDYGFFDRPFLFDVLGVLGAHVRASRACGDRAASVSEIAWYCDGRSYDWVSHVSAERGGDRAPDAGG